MDFTELVLRKLGELSIPFDLISHPPVHTMEDCAGSERILGGVMPKNLFLRPRRQEDFYLCITRPDAVYKASVVSRQAGASRLGFASEKELVALLHSKSGAANPLGLMFEEAREVRLLMDERLKEEERLIFHPCDNSYSLALSGSDFFDKFLPAAGHSVTWVSLSDEGAASE